MATDFYSVYTKATSGVWLSKKGFQTIYIPPLILMSKVDPERPKSYKYTRRTIIRTIFWDPSLDVESGDVLRLHVMMDGHFSGASPQRVDFCLLQISTHPHTHPPYFLHFWTLNKNPWPYIYIYRERERERYIYIYIYIYLSIYVCISLSLYLYIYEGIII